MKQIVNIADAPLETIGNGARFVAAFAALGTGIGARKLGVSLAVVPPGKCAFPRHNHHNNEEMLFIVDGEGTWHAGDESAPVRTGDLIAAPPGNAATAHQLENTSAAALTYLTFSTKLEPEVMEYPDSGKFAVVSKAGGDAEAFYVMGRAGASLDYFDGES